MTPSAFCNTCQKRIFVEMELKNFPQYEDVPPHWVPIPPTSTEWYLDHAESIQIKRRGFALSPDFSSTIHSATGRTLVSCVPDLNPIEVAPNAQDHSTPARSVVFHIVSLNHFFKFRSVPHFSAFVGCV